MDLVERRKDEDAYFDISKIFRVATFEVIQKIVFGYESEAQDKENLSWRKALWSAIIIGQFPGWFIKLTRLEGIVKYFTKDLRNLALRAIDQRTPGCVIEDLMNCRDEQLSAEDLIDESAVLLIAGHETTASALSWAIYLLTLPESQHVVAKVVEEVERILQGRGEIGFG